MSEAPTRYPLAWPARKPRRGWRERVVGDFSKSLDGVDGKKTRRVNVAEAAQRCEDELDRMGARWPILSTNLELRMDGRPRADRADPADPGACLYFDLKGVPHAMACDTYTTVEQNVAAIAAHLKAVRAIERYGVGTTAETLQAFAALPPPPDAKPKRPWWEVLGVVRTSEPDEIKAMFKVKANKAHPDKGGTAELMSELNVALKEALAEASA